MQNNIQEKNTRQSAGSARQCLLQMAGKHLTSIATLTLEENFFKILVLTWSRHIQVSAKLSLSYCGLDYNTANRWIRGVTALIFFHLKHWLNVCILLMNTK